MSHPVRWRSVLLYTALAFGLSWSAFIGLRAAGVPFLTRAGIGMFGPLAAALMTRLALGEGLGDVGFRFSRRGAGPWPASPALGQRLAVRARPRGHRRARHAVILSLSRAATFFVAPPVRILGVLPWWAFAAWLAAAGRLPLRAPPRAAPAAAPSALSA